MKHSTILNFTEFYRFGNPFETEAVIINKEEFLYDDNSKLMYFDIYNEGESTFLKYKMNENDYIFGLGENLGSLNKRGRKYRMYATDDPNHTPEKEALYGSHPFIIVDGKEKFGLLIDYPGEIIFDIGYENINEIKIEIKSKDFELYIFDEEDKNEIIKEYLTLTGKPFVPPKWAWGYQQCRWSYPDEETIKDIAHKFRSKGIPCDAIYMDIDYMENYKVFTIDRKKFPEFEKMVKDLKEEGFNLVPIIDPGVKIEKEYSVYEEGVKQNYFCKNKDGNDFVTAVWPGLTHFPDFLNNETRNWWGKKYGIFTDLGIYSFWNDMNEPAIFYTLRSFNNVVKAAENMKNDVNMGINAFLAKDKMLAMSNSREDYKSFYHIDDSGNKINHDDVHNLYGFNMTRATVQGFDKLIPDYRYFLLSRSSYTGHHRYATIWTGDNHSWWEHMLVHIRMIQSLNLSGFFYTGADVGGFGCNSNPELVIRWMQLGAFTPLYRNHAALGTRNQEPWSFDSKTEDILTDIIKLRYAFLPYSYSEYMKSVEDLTPFIRPLFLEFDNDRVKQIEDQYMYGESLMVAPIYTPNSRGRYVHLPEDKWLVWIASNYSNRSMKVLQNGDYYIEADLKEIPIFIRENHMIVLSEPTKYVGEKNIEKIILTGLITDKGSYTYYEDDGVTNEYKKGNYAEISVNVFKKEGEYEVEAEIDTSEDYIPLLKEIKLEIYDEFGNRFDQTLSLK